MKRLIIIIVGLAVFGALGYYAFTNGPTVSVETPGGSTTLTTSRVGDSSTGAAGSSPSAPQEPLKPAREAPAGTQEYRNTQYRFALFYPSTLSVKSYDEGGGASTITFQNTTTGQGFQIFIVPYGLQQITPEQFKKDEPSGVRNNTLPITVDGTQAVSFYGKDVALGATAEVWLIHGNYLYEVTTLKPLDSWLSPIIQSWIFI